jgi:hypothetical protein
MILSIDHLLDLRERNTITLRAERHNSLERRWILKKVINFVKDDA